MKVPAFRMRHDILLPGKEGLTGKLLTVVDLMDTCDCLTSIPV